MEVHIFTSHLHAISAVLVLIKCSMRESIGSYEVSATLRAFNFYFEFVSCHIHASE